MDENENTNGNTPAVTPPAATGDSTPVEPSTPVVQQPAQTTPAPVTVPDGYVKAEDVETERTARTAAERERDELRAERDRIAGEARQERITSIATRLGFNDPADAQVFIKADEQDIEGALKTLLESKSYLKKPEEAATPVVTPTSPTNPARTNSQAPTFTQAQIQDRNFWNQNKAAIMLAMKEGRITE